MRLVWIALVGALCGSPAWAQDDPESEPEQVRTTTRTAKEAPAVDAEEEADEPAEEAEGDAEESAEDVEDSDEEDLTLDDVLADEEDELRALIEAQSTQLAEQQAAIEDLQVELSETKLEMIPDPAIRVEWEGHYRVRAHMFNHLFQSQGNGKNYQDARYITHRLWLRPVFNYEDLAKLMVEMRMLDDVVWGDNVSNASTALFAETPSATGLEGQNTVPVNIGRVWTEFSVPAGLLRIGRQPTEWGMGILAQSGERHDKKFGTNHYASTNDRVLFATRPIAIYQKIAGKPDTEVPLYAGVAVDRLVEDPLIQYHGYQCTLGATGEDPRCDEDGDGVSDRDHDWTTDRTVDQRQQDWWADQADDVMQMVYLLVYRGEDIKYLGGTGDLTAGTWIVNRMQRETDSNVLIADIWLKADVHGVFLQFEGIRIVGDTRAITLPGSVGSGGDPLQKTANIWGYAGELGYHRPGWKVLMEHGFASGDDIVTDKDFTGRALNPDHNVGLLLYEEVLSRVTAANWTTDARGLWSKGGVYNSRYIFPTGHLYPLDNWELLGGFVMAWPHKPDGRNILCNDSDNVEDCNTAGPLQPNDAHLGWEVDLGLKHTWHEHLDFALEAGFAQTSDRIALESAGLNPEGKFFTVQSQIQYRF